MSEHYPHKQTEEKWHKKWEGNRTFKATGKGEKYYILEMFPYPSGYLHMGHIRVYSIGDVLAHYNRMQGKDVIHPMGYDAFGLPAENAAIKNNVHPAEWTKKNIEHARGQFKKLGMSYDWDRELATCDESYYRWNQWLFIKFFEKGLAYRKASAVNWCESCGTVLANEQVQEGKCWRCENTVVQKDLTQWFFKTTAYSQELLDGHNKIDWPERVIAMQKNWIGRSEGARILFKEEKTGEEIPVFTTRPDTIFGATYVVLAAQHPMVDRIRAKATAEKQKEIDAFRDKVKKMDVTVDTLLTLEKEGVDTGETAINPVNGKKVRIWIGNYVLMDYGTGAIMAVPTHDSRDFKFAKKYNLPMIVVIQPKDKQLKLEEMTDAYEDEGMLVNSGEFDGINNSEAKKKIASWMNDKGMAKIEINYRLKDWLLSRQRYWGTPIPAIYCDKCGIVMEKEENLPVKLPRDIEFSGKGNPLETSKSFLSVKCPKCGGDARRETDTMDTFVDSSWYFVRYCDSKNEKLPIGKEAAARELPVDQYVGGPEHACMHLIYARFFTYVMRDLGLISCGEPFKKLLTQGMVIKDGFKMSKSKGNTVSPDDMIEKYGSDTARLFMLFAAPPQADLEWNDEAVEGSYRFINRIWRKFTQYIDQVKGASDTVNYSALDEAKQKLVRKTHQTIKKVTNDIGVEQQFNTAVASLMELFNTVSATELDPSKDAPLIKFVIKSMALLMAPMTPHFSEELWEMLGNKESVFKAKWPVYDEALTIENTVEFVLQVNGKIRDKIKLDFNAPQDKAEAAAFASEKVLEWTKGKETVKKIFVPNKLFNIVVK
ncbi:MAG: leucine--tRNA ligase [Candidatus Goldbacteria bacterium]|nr:leucine--tRNA ligase [Candidatus Goldiibacteriota bacterium]